MCNVIIIDKIGLQLNACLLTDSANKSHMSSMNEYNPDMKVLFMLSMMKVTQGFIYVGTSLLSMMSNFFVE